MAVPPILEQAYQLQMEGQLVQAERLYGRALTTIRDNPAAWFNHGLVLKDMGRAEAALASFDQALLLAPQAAEIFSERGSALMDLGRFIEALAALDKAAALKPGHAGTFVKRGRALSELKRVDDALASYDMALRLNPRLPAALGGRASMLEKLERLDEAMASYSSALSLNPQDCPALNGRGLLLAKLNRFAEAMADYDRALAINPGLVPVQFNRAVALALLRQCATDYTASIISGPGAPPPRPRTPAGRLRIGYLSYDFRHHPVSSSNAAVLERHDRSRFEVFAFSIGPNDASAMRRRLEQGFEHFFDVGESGDREIAARIEAAGLDLLVDLGGHTTGARLGILAARPAPVQVNYQGWPGTTGTDFMDYILADSAVIPPGHEQYFSETVVRLPHCYMPSDPTRALATTPSRKAVGLPEQGFVFCAFNSCWKITPALFDIWMQLLHAVPGSVLWLRIDGEEPIANLRREAVARGVAPDRLVVAPRADEAEHLSRHRLADLFLDSFPFTGHSTAIDALWAGLPLVTCVGRSFASRVSGSVLQAAGVAEFAVTSLDDYKALALRLATDADFLAGYRRRLESAPASPLFDATGLCRSLEAAYTRMVEISRSGRSPESFTVTD